MTDENRCAGCGVELPADAPLELCPACLLRRALETQTDAGELGQPGADYAPPTPDELAAYFPELEIVELLGRGGMGVVYKARQKRLDRLVALKILSPRFSQAPAFAERFAREARAMAMLSHPHIVAVYDFGQTMVRNAGRGTGGEGQGMGDSPPIASPLPPGEGKGEGEAEKGQDASSIPLVSPFSSLSCSRPLYYFLMEYVDGVNLRRLLDTQKLSPEEALAIVPQICDALQYAHDVGVVHRDIKPENILLDKRGRVKIADFGIAKLVRGERREERGEGISMSPLPPREGQGEGGQDAASVSQLTATGEIIGTPQYMAPEQIEHPLQVDHRADIYSLGVVFYQMLTGELPIGRFAPPSKKVEIDVRLDEVVLRALEKEPERRYQQVSEFKTRVENIAATPEQPPANSEAITQQMLARDYVVDIGSCLRRGWALVKNEFWPIVGVTALVLLLLHAAAALGPLAFVIGGPLVGGLCLFVLRRIRGEQTSVEAAISGVREVFVSRFFQLFLTGLVAGALTLIGLVCLIVPGIFLGVAWAFALAIVADKHLDFWPAMELSRKMVSKHWWTLFALLAVLTFINLAGLLAFGVGVFLTAPITLAALMYAYEDIFGSTHRAPATGSASVAPPDDADHSDTPAQNTGGASGTPASATGHRPPSRRLPVVIVAIGVPLSLLVVISAMKGDWFAAIGAFFLIAVLVLVSGIIARKSRAGKAAILVSALFFLVVLVLLMVSLAQYFDKVGHDFGGWPSIARMLRREPATPLGPTLIYETDPKSTPLSEKNGKAWGIVRLRLDRSPERLAYVRMLEDGRITVCVLNEGDAARRRVERLVTSPGTLEFRVLADAHHDKAIIDRAMQEPSKSEVLDSSGKKLAWWVPVKAGSERNVAGSGYAGIARRTKKSGDRDVTEILVVADAYNVTGGYLSRIEAATDRRGQPCLSFEFCDAGAQLFERLTGDHLPDRATDFAYKLAFILDGEVYSAPSIQSRISNKCEITGSLTAQEVSDLVRILTAGPLLVRLRLVQVVPPGMPPSASVIDRAQPETPGNETDLQPRTGEARPVERQPSQAQPDLRGSSRSTPKAELPKLCFLAWQDENKESPKGRAWHADGAVVDDQSELRVLAHVRVVPFSVENSELAKENSRFLHLWFSHPGIDRQSYRSVTLLDAAGKPFPPIANGVYGNNAYPPDANNDHVGWIVFTLSPGAVGHIPKMATIRLEYSVGPWTHGEKILPSFSGVNTLHRGVMLSGIGQTAAGKAFVATAEDWSGVGTTQFSFTATTKDGRELDNPSTTRGGPVGGPAGMEQFEFDVSLDQIKTFHFRTRPIKTVEFKNVSLQPGQKTDVQVVVPAAEVKVKASP